MHKQEKPGGRYRHSLYHATVYSSKYSRQLRQLEEESEQDKVKT